jgi:hypothetical protein
VIESFSCKLPHQHCNPTLDYSEKCLLTSACGFFSPTLCSHLVCFTSSLIVSDYNTAVVNFDQWKAASVAPQAIVKIYDCIWERTACGEGNPMCGDDRWCHRYQSRSPIGIYAKPQCLDTQMGNKVFLEYAGELRIIVLRRANIKLSYKIMQR